jgi:hypothetical protein
MVAVYACQFQLSTASAALLVLREPLLYRQRELDYDLQTTDAQPGNCGIACSSDSIVS